MRTTDGIVFHFPNNNTLNSSDVEIIHEQDSLYDVPVGLIVLLSIFYGTISILAVIGNSLVIWIVLTTKQMQTITNMFIANLALADVTIGVFAIPFQFQAAVLQRWNLPDFMCPFCPFVQLLSVNVSVFTLTAIAVDRHRAIINPLRARTSKNISKFVISAIWMLSFALAAPTLFALRVVPISIVSLEDNNETYSNMTKPFCQVVNFEESEMLLYRYILTLVQYFIPLFVISFVYIQMAFRLWGSKTPGNAQDSRDMTMLKNKKKVIKMLIIVVALFGICWFPLQLYNVLHVTWPQVNEYRYINIIWFVCDWLAMSNSCYNPFIYGIYNEKFKREFHKRYPFRGRSHSNYHQDQLTDKTLSMFTRVSSIRSNYATSSIRNKLYTRPTMGAAGAASSGGAGSFHQKNHNATMLNRSSNNEISKVQWDPKSCPCGQQQQQLGKRPLVSAKLSNCSGTTYHQMEQLSTPAPDSVNGHQLHGQRDDCTTHREIPLCATERKFIKVEKLEEIALDHPHPDSADDECAMSERVSSSSATRYTVESSVDDELEADEQQRLTSASAAVGGGGGGRRERLNLYSKNLQNFHKLYN